MNRYNSYKDSDVFWINNYPSHWGITLIKNKYFIGRGRVISNDDLKDDGLYPVFSSQTKNNGCLGYINSFDFDEKLITWTTDGANAGTVFLRDGKFNCTNVCGTLKPKNNKIKIEFDAYFLKFATQFYKRPDTNGAKIMNNEMAVIITLTPPFHEQEQIVAYLDKKTAIVNTLITSKEQKINLLKEKRTALINHVITKGLDPNVQFKDSGVEWIGEIPEHWVMKKMKYIFQIQKRISGELGYNVLSITQKGIKIKDIESGKGQVSMDYTKYQIVEIGDFAMNHMDLLTGYIDISPYKGVTSPDYRVFSQIDNNINSKFYLYLFQFGYTNKVFYGFGQGSSMFGRWRLPSLEFNNFKLPYPSIEEQNKIVNFLEEQFQQIEHTISLEEKKIETLKEYRQALISEVVTGKIKVVKD